MKQPIHILYISGLGDHYDSFRLRALKRWRFRNVTVELVPMKWKQGTFDQKLAQIDQAIDRAIDKRVVLIGESAGGSMAVHMLARRGDIYKVMTLCGKNTHPETVSEEYYRNHPAFVTSMQRLNESLATLTDAQKHDFVSIHSLYDSTVPVKETVIEGCKEIRLPVIGHMYAIVMALTVFAPIVVRVAKK